MGQNQYDLHETRLATTDEHGHRVYLHPEDIKGKWRSRRHIVYWVLILIYLVLPWIYIDGKQWILLNIAKREFTIFGTTFYGHDSPLLIFILLGFLFFIGFVTSIWGRVWCGWACPQTVFIDSIFRKIEKLIEGNARKRRDLDKSPMGPKKLFLRSTKWFLFTLVSLHIVHSGLGYFIGTHKLFWITLSSPAENPTLFVTMVVLTVLVLFDFGWFREQFCIIACPYGRFQSVIMDENSLVVGYDKKRGEPRRAKDVTKEQEGDCIDCKRCVKACPTGIDIRRASQQLECIACTMCIDACDDIMRKTNKPEGLIRYTTETELDQGHRKTSKRSYLYAVVAIAMIIGLSTVLSIREDINFQVLRGSKTPFSLIETAKGKLVVNHFKIKIHNNRAKEKIFDIKSPGQEFELVSPMLPFHSKNANEELDIFIKFEPKILNNGRKTIFLNIVTEDKIYKQLEVKLVGPFN